MSTPAPSTPPRESPEPSVLEDLGTLAMPLGHLYPNERTGHIFVSDSDLAGRLTAERADFGIDRWDEVWNGVLVMSPQPNLEHQDFTGELHLIFRSVLPPAGGCRVYISYNVSDRDEGWIDNNRGPDLGVYLAGNPARDCRTHMLGGPDLAVEILSHKDSAREKLDFYAQINTREVLMIDREPWSLELYRLVDGRLELVAVSTVDLPAPLTSQVLPLSFRLVAGDERPTLEVAQVGGDQIWRI